MNFIYWPIGMASQYPCPAGAYTDSTSLTKSSDCTPFSAGNAWEEGIGTGTKAKLNCAAGYYWPQGTKQPYTNLFLTYYNYRKTLCPVFPFV